jgi:hypothetical protein
MNVVVRMTVGTVRSKQAQDWGGGAGYFYRRPNLHERGDTSRLRQMFMDKSKFNVLSYILWFLEGTGVLGSIAFV